MTRRYYRPIKEWFAGFAVTTAVQKAAVIPKECAAQ